MFGKHFRRKNTALESQVPEQAQEQHNRQAHWDKLEQVDDVYCSDTFNIFNDIY